MPTRPPRSWPSTRLSMVLIISIKTETEKIPRTKRETEKIRRIEWQGRSQMTSVCHHLGHFRILLDLAQGLQMQACTVPFYPLPFQTMPLRLYIANLGSMPAERAKLTVCMRM